ncbi:glutamine synthetase III family protein [Candidatus Protochlamydia sp. R18]|uniref:glutamine synthetase III family protein n=1 Tax=Candidatus Protochlamydia sp. R18 TaxID=1353977 RepID=UPI000693FD3E|nr:glutamine synthetase III [Candidatus Protochlamydia sp. R18]
MRKQILKEMSEISEPPKRKKTVNSQNFGKYVFSRTVMQKMLSEEIYKNVSNAINGREKIKAEYADSIAIVVKEWAMSHGATHFCHWFQPLTGASAEKHDAFIEWNSADGVMEKFNGKQLIQGEPDASSFPSGGLRSTYEARGYTGWDPTSPIFLWKAGDGVTLCIPSVFFSWTGDVLDSKIPLLRSERKIDQAALRLLQLTGLEAEYVYSTLGLEQEYFVIDRKLRNLRPDLILLGKTVFGAPSPKSQELQDHYFGSVKDRILTYMRAFEDTAIELGIPVKTRHNEVAPAQHEVAPIFEKSTVAIDHNILLMELMRQVAQKQGLTCLLHEKPFMAINGSGKHSNWSLSTDKGVNLLDLTDTPHNNLHFLILMTAILYGVYQHSTLLRAAIGSASNDYRLGGHEAPPVIMSIYLGEELETLLNEIEEKGNSTFISAKNCYDLGTILPDLSKDNTDRNRTSPFAFTGNKFEFRAVGSSSNPAFPVTVLNLAVAESLHLILDEIEFHTDQTKGNTEAISKAIFPVLQKYLKIAKAIRFTGDNYHEDWIKEAQKRGLPNFKCSSEAFLTLTHPKTIHLFDQILTSQELASRQEALLETYTLNMTIEVNLMLDMFKTQILPAVFNYQTTIATSYLRCKQTLSSHQFHSIEQNAWIKEINDKIEESIKCCKELEMLKEQLTLLTVQEKARVFGEKIIVKMEQFRAIVDDLEVICDDALWPFPKYRELLFMI